MNLETKQDILQDRAIAIFQADVFYFIFLFSWFAAIWIYPLSFFLTGLFAAFLGFVCTYKEEKLTKLLSGKK